MFKRMLTLLLCLAVLSVCLAPCGLAEETAAKDTQLSKLTGQWKSSGFSGELTGKVDGEAPSFLAPAVWQQLGYILNGYRITFTHTQQSRDGSMGSEGILTLKNAAGDEKARINLLLDASGVRYIQSPLLDDEGRFYAFDSGFDWSSLLMPSENGWPSLLHVVMELNRGNETWQEKARPYLENFSMILNRWMQNYLVTSDEVLADGNQVATMTYEIPVAAVVMQTKQMLVEFYSKPELLSLVGELLTAEEQAAYLQTGMLYPFIQMLDNVNLTGNISIRRQNEMITGTLLYESISLPFPNDKPWKSLTLTHVPNAEGGELWQINAVLDAERLGIALEQDLIVDLTAQNAEGAIWTGSLRAVLPASKDPESIAQEDQMLFSCTYNLNIPAPEDVNDVYQSRYERKYETTLVVKPDQTMSIPAFSLSWTGLIYSKENKVDSICYVQSGLEWSSLDSDSTVSLEFNGRTRMRWTPTMLNSALNGALRLDMMSSTDRMAVLNQLASHFVLQLPPVLN